MVKNERERDFNLTLRFEPHVVWPPIPEAFELTTRILAGRFWGVFSEGKNVCLLEGDGTKLVSRPNSGFKSRYDLQSGFMPHFREGARSFNSFRYAHVYAKRMMKSPPDYSSAIGEEVERITEKCANEDSDFAYRWATLGALDMLRSAGFDIDVVFELSTPGIEPPTIEKLRKEYKEAHYAKKTLIDWGAYVRRRNRTIGRQIVGLVNRAQKKEQPTNIFVLLGTGHSGVIDFLPAEIFDKTVATSRLKMSREGEFGALGTKKDVILSKLASGFPVLDDEWAILEKEAKRLGV